MPLTKQELVAAVKKHAREHYEEGGWDYVVEAYDDNELAEAIGNAQTVRGAIANVRKIVGVQDSVRSDVEAEYDGDKDTGAVEFSPERHPNGRVNSRRERALDRWAKRYASLDGAPENDSDV